MFFAVLKKKSFIIAICLLLAFIVTVSTLSFTGAYRVFYGLSIKKLPIYSVKTEEKKVAISFDCAWGVDYTDKLLEIMESENVKCTFFAVEFWTVKHPEYIKKISDAGHEIGTHSATHPHMSKLSAKAINKELMSSVKAITDITEKKVEVFRAPFGEYNDTVIEEAEKLGLYTIQWDVDSLDWKDLSAAEIEKRITERVKCGSIVLFHNQGLHTAEALPKIIKALKNDGYTFVRIGDLIYREGYSINSLGEQIKNV